MEASRTLLDSISGDSIPGDSTGRALAARSPVFRITPASLGLTLVLAIVTLAITSGLLLSPVRAGGPLTGVEFVVDPGHGGSDPGATGPGGLREADVNLRVGTMLRNYLAEYGGATVQMTRTSDVYVSLSDRANLANSWGAHRFISIHHNASSDPSVNGTETYAYTYGSSLSFDLRNKVHAQLLVWGGLPDRGAKTANFYVLKYTNMPAILTEASFISNPYEEARLRQSEYTSREALAIYKGVLLHFDRSDLLVTPPGNIKLRDALSFPLPAW
ncbi:MAG: N-acetylmuramoyl-L-alanine amidase family protein [Bacteroidota bacterium]